MYLVSVDLPEPYFEWSSGKLVSGRLRYWMEPQEWPLFVKYGTIVPLLDLNECLSLEDCYENSHTIQVWGRQAEGLLYVDDGISLPVEGALFLFTFKEGILWATCLQKEVTTRDVAISAVEICGFGSDMEATADGKELLVECLNDNCQRILVNKVVKDLEMFDTAEILQIL